MPLTDIFPCAYPLLLECGQGQVVTLPNRASDRSLEILLAGQMFKKVQQQLTPQCSSLYCMTESKLEENSNMIF